MGRGLQLSYDLMQTWRTPVCRLYINQYPKVGIVERPQDREREESILTMHRSNQNTGLCNSHVDHDDTPRSVSNVRSPFDTPERRKRASEHADSSRSEQKYSQEARLTAGDTLRTDSSEDDTIYKTNESQHYDIDETFETQHNTPNEESKAEDIQRRIKTRCDQVQSTILFVKKDSRQRITQSERKNKFKK